MTFPGPSGPEGVVLAPLALGGLDAGWLPELVVGFPLSLGLGQEGRPGLGVQPWPTQTHPSLPSPRP